MSYPRFVFKDEGPHQRAGGSYDRLLVEDADEEATALDKGWFANLQDAIDGMRDEDAPPTREELEAKATELGIKFDARFGDKRLALLIQEKLEA